MKKGLFFTICLLLAFFSVFSVWLSDSIIINRNKTVMESPGVYRAPSLADPYDLDELLIGSWEYYEGSFLVSGDDLSSLPGHVLSRPFDEEAYMNDAMRSYRPSFEPNPSAEHITLPDRVPNLKRLFQSHSSKASYRLVIKDCYMTGNDPLFLCLLGTVRGNYRIFVNGKLCGTRMNQIWGYPIYLLERDAAENEVIIEVSNNSGVWNVTPRLMTVATSMVFFDLQKNISLIVASVLVAVFLILLLFLVSARFKDLRKHFLLGLLFTLFYILSIIWGSGFLDSITLVIPNSLLYALTLICAVCGFCVFLSEKKQRSLVLILLSCAGLLLLLTYMLPGISTLLILIGHLIFVGIVIYLIVDIYKNIATLSEDEVLLNGGVFVVFGEAAVTLINNQTGISKWIYMANPAGILFYAVLIALVLWRKEKRQMQRLEELLALEKENVRMQMAMYSTQINPHFLNNTLMSIQEMCYTDPKEAANLIVVFSKYLRNNIDFMESSDLIPFTEELSHIDSYIYVQKARFGEKLVFEKIIEESAFLLPPLSVQPIVENAIKYGVRTSETGGKVVLHTFKENDEIHIAVEDDGPGFEPDIVGSNHSLQNIRTRVELLTGGRLEITSSGPDTKGVKVEIILPAQD